MLEQHARNKRNIATNPKLYQGAARRVPVLSEAEQAHAANLDLEESIDSGEEPEIVGDESQDALPSAGGTGAAVVYGDSSRPESFGDNVAAKMASSNLIRDHSAGAKVTMPVVSDVDDASNTGVHHWATMLLKPPPVLD